MGIFLGGKIHAHSHFCAADRRVRRQRSEPSRDRRRRHRRRRDRRRRERLRDRQRQLQGDRRRDGRDRRQGPDDRFDRPRRVPRAKRPANGDRAGRRLSRRSLAGRERREHDGAGHAARLAHAAAGDARRLDHRLRFGVRADRSHQGGGAVVLAERQPRRQREQHPDRETAATSASRKMRATGRSHRGPAR